MVFAALLIGQMVLEPVHISIAQHRPMKRYRQKAVAALYMETIEVAADTFHVPVGLIMAVIAVESGWDPKAVSACGAVGLMQLLPSTAEELGVDPWSPRQNIVGGVAYLARMFRMFGDWDLAIAAYNAGPGRVQRLGRVPRIPETQAYVKKVMAFWASGEPWR